MRTEVQRRHQSTVKEIKGVGIYKQFLCAMHMSSFNPCCNPNKVLVGNRGFAKLSGLLKVMWLGCGRT